MRGKSLMMMGTGSSVGKSLLTSALLRIFKQDGLKVAPFKAQNMALNSFATAEGLEMGRAQVVQAEAAGIVPSVRMNPVLLKPTSDRRSQVIVNGKPIGNMTAIEYHKYKPELRRMIKETYDALEAEYDAVVIEGAGSPAEINLREGDIVNMSMANAADAPVILIGDIDLGGVFASLYGTVMLLSEAERLRIKGVIINKFRGDGRILQPGLKMLEDLIHIPVVGVVPMLDIDMEDEDGVSERFKRTLGEGAVQVCVVRLPHISNFTDFNPISREEGVSVYYAEGADALSGADIIILPGTKNTIEDLLHIKQNGVADAVIRHAKRGGLVIGVCGGYQMLGEMLYDPEHSESRLPEIAGLGLLPVTTTFHQEKITEQSLGEVRCEAGFLQSLNGLRLDGYEIHSGKMTFLEGALPFLYIHGQDMPDGMMNRAGTVFGTHLHGLFDQGHLWRTIVNHVREGKGLSALQGSIQTMTEFREREFDRLADLVRQSLDMQKVYRILRGEAL